MSPSKLPLLCAFGALIAAFAGSTPAHAADAQCSNADVAPRANNAEDVGAAVLCLINAERTQRGLRALRENAKLRRAALAHSSDMVRGGFFSHTARDGDTLVDRIIGAGYARRNDGWTLGENLAWGTGDVATPRAIHAAWMRSSGHRANIVKPAFRELGVGIRVGVPHDAGTGATFTTDFGAKT